ncbi:MAG: NUDIX domain-containing protein [Caldilineaceae bacterium]|nr:NUDIX domain-containing protein [Caldilineaceae bacterium]
MARLRYVTGGGVVLCMDQVVLLDRPSRQEIRLPKGHVESGEDPAAAARRETVEETGFADLCLLAGLGVRTVKFEYRNQRVHRTEHWFLYQLGSAVRQDRPPEDERQFRTMWRPWDLARDLLTFEAERRVLAEAVLVWRKLQARA